MGANIPLLEFDPAREAVINPRPAATSGDVPMHAVACFFQDVIADLRRDGRARQIACLRSEIGEHPVYAVDVEQAGKQRRVALFHPGVGAPLAAGFLEEMIALGCRRFIARGGAGVLDSSIALGHLLVPATAVRDEGTSYHYLPPSWEVAACPKGVAAIERTLQRQGVDYVVTKTWTTDALYRETPATVRQRRAEGCLAVEMEAAAFFAVARFRGVTFAHILYGGDDVGGATWDHRDWIACPVRERLFWLAAEACLDVRRSAVGVGR